MLMEIQVLVWDRHKYVVGLNQLMGSQPIPHLDNWISNGNADINKPYKTCTDFLTLINSP
jgi:hypothetical protein